jgi:cyclophilin family peptidyl-prolyl cis-trans isomerase
MGKAQKLKEQRKIERLAKKERRAKRKKTAVRSVLGFFIVLIILSVGFLGTSYAKNKWFTNNKKTANTESKVEGVENKNDKYRKAPDMTIDANKTYIAKVETSKGSFEVELDAKNTPITVNNFVFLAKDKFYDGLKFHRIMKEFMIQGGDPKGDGTGGPGYKFNDEKIVGDYTAGTLAMANSGANTNGSQFFIMTGDYSSGKLPKDYVIFGQVTSGMETIQSIAATPTVDNGQGEQSKPGEDVTINKVTIEEK